MHSLPSFNHIRKAAFLALTAILLTFAIRPLFAASIMLPDGSTYNVELIAHGGGSYTYQVSEVSGKDLSHWLLEFGVCAERLVSAEPTGYEVGLDASTGYTGIKWNVTDAFTADLFTITLDAEYPIGQVQALVKAGSQHAVGYVDGPLCNVQPPPQDPEPPTATPTPELPAVCQSELPALLYLGDEDEMYTLPDGYDYFIVKSNSPFSFNVFSGPDYDNAKERRVWACQNGTCQVPAVYHDAVDLGHYQAGATIGLAILDDDIDERVNYWALGDPNTPYTPQTQQGMVVYTSLTVPESGNWYYYASDSIGLYVTCQQPPTPTPTNTPADPTATQTPQPPDDPAPTTTPTPVCEPDMVRIGDSCVTLTPTPTTQPGDPTPTLLPPVTVTIVPPTATPLPTEPPATPTLIPPVTVTPPTPTPTVPPTNEDDGPEPTFWFYWLPLVSDCRFADTGYQDCGR